MAPKRKWHAIGVLIGRRRKEGKEHRAGMPKIVKPTTRNRLRRSALDLRDAPLNPLAARALPQRPRNGRLFREISPWDRGDLHEPIALHEAASAVGRMPGSAEFVARYQAKDGPIDNYAVNSNDSSRLVSTRSRAPRSQWACSRPLFHTPAGVWRRFPSVSPVANAVDLDSPQSPWPGHGVLKHRPPNQNPPRYDILNCSSFLSC